MTGLLQENYPTGLLVGGAFHRKFGAAKGGGELRTAAAAAFRSATARRAALGAEMGRLRRPEHFNPGGWRPPSAAGTQKERHDSRRVFLFGARGGSRTRTPLRALAPEASESTNSTTRASGAVLMYRSERMRFYHRNLSLSTGFEKNFSSVKYFFPPPFAQPQAEGTRSAGLPGKTGPCTLPAQTEIFFRAGCIQYPLTRAFSTWAATLPAAPAPLPPSSTTTAKA